MVILLNIGLMGADDWEEATIVMLTDVVNDALSSRLKAHFCKDESMKVCCRT